MKKLLSVLIGLMSQSVCAQQIHLLTLNAQAGPIKQALYGGLVENKVIQRESENTCWYGTFQGQGYKSVEQRDTSSDRPRSRTHQAPHTSRELNSLITQIKQFLKKSPKRFSSAYESGQDLINLDSLAISSDTQLSKLAQRLIKSIKQTCRIKT